MPAGTGRVTASASADADLSPTQRRLTVLAIVALHLAAVWGLMQVNAVREAIVQVAPIFVNLLATPAPPTPKPLSPPELPKPQPVVRPKPLPPRPVAPPLPAPLLSVPDTAPAEAAVVVPPPLPPTPQPVAAPPAVVAPPAPPPAPAPRQLPDSAVQYLEPPQLIYPPLSLRKRESGLVVVRAFVGTAGGTPRSVEVERSSGHARLDQAALSAVGLARFKPYAERGVPVEGWALIPIRFELEK